MRAELKKPYPGGNPWSGTYNMFQARSTATREQLQGEYIMTRDTVNAFHGRGQWLGVHHEGAGFPCTRLCRRHGRAGSVSFGELGHAKLSAQCTCSLTRALG